MWAIHCSQPVAKHASKAYKIKDQEKRSIWAISLPLSASLSVSPGASTPVLESLSARNVRGLGPARLVTRTSSKPFEGPEGAEAVL